MKLKSLSQFFVSLLLMMFCVSMYANNTDQVRQYSSDTAITSTVKAKFAADPILSSWKVSVATQNSVVNLSGEVGSDTEYERAILIASNTDGVEDVNVSGLKVKSSNQPLTDTYITAKIKSLLLKNDLLSIGADDTNSNTWNVHVETKNSVVYLTGKVKSKRQANDIINVAKSVKNVKNVKSDFTYQG